MNRRSLYLYSLLLLTASAALVLLSACSEPTEPTPESDPAAVATLKKAFDPAAELSFSGVVETEEPGRDEHPKRVVQLYRDGAGGRFRLDWLEPESRKGITLVRVGRKVVFSQALEPSDGSGRRRGGHRRKYRNPKFLINDADKLSTSYEIKSGGRVKALCGREAELITIAAPDPASRPSMKLWIDVETSKVLEAVRLSPAGAKTYSFAFREIDLKPTFDETLFDFPENGVQMGRGPAGGTGHEPLSGEIADVQKAFDFPVGVPTFLPRGFALIKQIKVRTETGGEMLVLVYSDGLTVMTLSQMAKGKSPCLPAKEGQGPKNTRRRPLGFRTAYARTVEETGLVLTSELPAETSKKILGSFEVSD